MKKNTPTPKIVAAPVLKKPQRGVYVYKPLISVVVLCVCGNKYIATRPKQKECITCLMKVTRVG